MNYSNESLQSICVTPTLATEWLNLSKNPRTLRSAVVHKYAQQMQQGSWRPNLSVIGFNSQGLLVDGQHRLSAVIRSNTNQYFYVRKNLGLQDIFVLDSGLRRNDADVLKTANLIENPKITSTLKAVLQYSNLKTHGSLVQIISNLPECILTTTYQIQDLVGNRKPMDATVKSVFVRALNSMTKIDVNMINSIITCLITSEEQINLTPAENSYVRKLREKLLNIPSQGEENRKKRVVLTESVLYHLISGIRPLPSKLYALITTEPFLFKSSLFTPNSHVWVL